MRVTFTTEGGIAFFPGLSRPMVVDSTQLSNADANQLQNLVEQADFFTRSDAAQAVLKGAADYQHYTITIEDDQLCHTIRLSDPIDDQALADLLTFLRAHASPTAQRGAILGPEPKAPKRSKRKRPKPSG